MKLNILGDFLWETKIDQVLLKLSAIEYREYFAGQIYGDSLDAITVVLICQNPELHLNQRIRFSRKERKIYMDIILDLNLFTTVNQIEKDKIVVYKLISEVPAVIAKYKLKNFDLAKFQSDFKKWISKILI